MPNPSSEPRQRAAKSISRLAERSEAAAPEYPVREYIGSMAEELAQMARWDGDEGLAALLDAVADRARTRRAA